MLAFDLFQIQTLISNIVSVVLQDPVLPSASVVPPLAPVVEQPVSKLPFPVFA